MKEISLLQMIAFCVEKNECLNGWSWRQCPFSSEEEAIHTFEQWLNELVRWKGPTTVEQLGSGRRAQWPDLRIKQQGLGIGLWIRPGDVFRWWGDEQTWKEDPCAYVWAWEWD